MSEAIDQPAAAGVEGPGNAAQTDDDISTEAFDRQEAPEDDAEEPREDADKLEGDADDPDKPKPETEDDGLVDVEIDGHKLRVPPAAKAAFMRHDDYTRKTQEAAELKRTLEAERTTWESQREQSRAALPAEHQRVAVLEHQLSTIDAQLDPKGKGLGAVDWVEYRTQVADLASDDPARIRYDQLRGQYMALRDSRIDLGDQIGEAKKDLTTKEAERLETQRTAEAAERAKQVEDTGKALVQAIPGWSPTLATDTAKFMVTDLGVAVEEIEDLTDPRVWIMAHRLRTAEAKNATLEKALKQQDKAADHGKAQTTTPADKPKGGGANPRDPSTPRGDGLSTSTWMAKRNAQIAAKRRA